MAPLRLVLSYEQAMARKLSSRSRTAGSLAVRSPCDRTACGPISVPEASARCALLWSSFAATSCNTADRLFGRICVFRFALPFVEIL